MKWISVKEKPIPQGEFVIAGMFLGSFLQCGENFEERIICIDDMGEIRNQDWEYDTAWDIDDYTHWMPLPEPPKE